MLLPWSLLVGGIGVRWRMAARLRVVVNDRCRLRGPPHTELHAARVATQKGDHHRHVHALDAGAPNGHEDVTDPDPGPLRRPAGRDALHDDEPLGAVEPQLQTEWLRPAALHRHALRSHADGRGGGEEEEGDREEEAGVHS
jgi:hypothetical protein